jgi:hypothetical protein
VREVSRAGGGWDLLRMIGVTEGETETMHAVPWNTCGLGGWETSGEVVGAAVIIAQVFAARASGACAGVFSQRGELVAHRALRQMRCCLCLGPSLRRE